MATEVNLSALNGVNGVVINGIDGSDTAGVISIVGDIDGDGLDDLVIGAPGADQSGTPGTGEAYVVFGNSNTFGALAGASLNLSALDGLNGFLIAGFAQTAGLGTAVAGAVDINNDGLDDLILGANRVDGDTGEAYVVFGSTNFGTTGDLDQFDLSTLDGSNGFVIAGIDASDEAGRSVQAAGDINNDGFGDLIIGGPFADQPGHALAGQSFVVFGASGGFPATLDLSSLDGDNGFAINGIDGEDFSGFAVSGAGDVNGDGVDDLIIGAPGADGGGAEDSGQSYVVFGSSLPDSFDEPLELSSLDGVNGFAINGVDADDGSGSAVAGLGDINGDGLGDLLIGAPEADGDGAPSAGESYVVFGSSGFGTTGASSELGLSELDGTNGFTISGLSSTGESGSAVSRAGDVNNDGLDDLIIGAPGEGSDAGSAFVVFGSTDFGTSGAPATLDATDLDGADGFVVNGIDAGDGAGSSVSGDGDINGDGVADLLIGAPNGEGSGGAASGESYVLFGSSGGPSVAIGAAEGMTTGARPFTVTVGFSEEVTGFEASDIAVAGGTVVGPLTTADDTTFFAAIRPDAPGPVTVDVPAAVASNTLGEDNTAAPSFVTTYAPDMPETGLAAIELDALNGSNGFVINGIEEGDFAGYAVSEAGDINGDGLADLIVGARFADDTGQAYVLFGRSGLGNGGDFDLSSIDGVNGFVLNGVDAGDQFSRSLDSLGDVNGDGIDDLIIGAPSGSAGGAQSGESYVVFGSTDLGVSGAAESLDLSSLDGQNGFVLNGVDPGDQAGIAVSSAGDVNDDGLEDFIIGAFLADPNGVDRAGESYLVFGSSEFGASGAPSSFDLASLDGENGFVLNGISGADRSGLAVSSAGDVNGDDIDDLVVTAPAANPGGARFEAGETYVVFGSSNLGTDGSEASLDLSTLDGTNGFTINGIGSFPAFIGNNNLRVGDRSGSRVASGDLNGDGLSDLVIGAYRANPDGRRSAGEAYVVFGSTDFVGQERFELSALDGVNGFRIEGLTAFDRFARSLDVAEDVNGDGIQDLIIGADLADQDGAVRAGESYVIFGSTDFGTSGASADLDLAALTADDGFILQGRDAGDLLGRSVSGLGDVNGDGAGDFIIGAYGADPNEVGRLGGESYVIFGTAGEVVNGQNGDDIDLMGSDNDEVVNGLGGNDVIRTGNGNDTVNGGAGDDTIFGNPGNDVISGGSGNDQIFGGQNEDMIFGDQGNDLLSGNRGNDTVNGGSGNDRVRGNDDDDLLIGGFGIDTLVGESGNDTMQGDTGADIFVLTDSFNPNGVNGSGAFGDEEIVDFEVGVDVVDASTQGAVSTDFDVTMDGLINVDDVGASVSITDGDLLLTFANGTVLFDGVAEINTSDVLFS